jgi:hypothetical protein
MCDFSRQAFGVHNPLPPPPPKKKRAHTETIACTRVCCNMITALPTSLQCVIHGYLDAKEHVHLALCSRHWSDVCRESSFGLLELRSPTVPTLIRHVRVRRLIWYVDDDDDTDLSDDDTDLSDVVSQPQLQDIVSQLPTTDFDVTSAVTRTSTAIDVSIAFLHYVGIPLFTSVRSLTLCCLDKWFLKRNVDLRGLAHFKTLIHFSYIGPRCWKRNTNIDHGDGVAIDHGDGVAIDHGDGVAIDHGDGVASILKANCATLEKLQLSCGAMWYANNVRCLINNGDSLHVAATFDSCGPFPSLTCVEMRDFITTEQCDWMRSLELAAPALIDLTVHSCWTLGNLDTRGDVFRSRFTGQNIERLKWICSPSTLPTFEPCYAETLRVPSSCYTTSDSGCTTSRTHIIHQKSGRVLACYTSTVQL